MNRQRAHVSLHAGRASAEASASLTPAGLLAIGALVAGTLLATAVLVRIAVRESKA